MWCRLFNSRKTVHPTKNRLVIRGSHTILFTFNPSRNYISGKRTAAKLIVCHRAKCFFFSTCRFVEARDAPRTARRDSEHRDFGFCKIVQQYSPPPLPFYRRAHWREREKSERKSESLPRQFPFCLFFFSRFLSITPSRYSKERI